MVWFVGLMLACSPSTASDAKVSTARIVEEGTPDAFGMLDFLNAETTTLELLDYDVRLDSRAAHGLTQRVLGPDGVWGTHDDDPFRTIEDVDDVYYVGDSALTKIRDYARAYGWMTNAKDPAQCTLEAMRDDTVWEFDRLLELLTTMETPWADVVALKAHGCDPTTTRLTLLADVIDGPGLATAGATTDFVDAVDESMAVIMERTEAGDWDQQDNEAIDYYWRQLEIRDAMVAPIESAAGVTSVWLEAADANCASVAAIADDGRVWLLRINDGCE
jgi:hypothetical protein